MVCYWTHPLSANFKYCFSCVFVWGVWVGGGGGGGGVTSIKKRILTNAVESSLCSN